MSTYEIPSSPGGKMISLYNLLEEMLGCYERIKNNHRNFFINEVPRNMSVCSGKDRLPKLMSDLFAVITSNPGNNCVRISARKTEKDVMLYIKKTEIRGFSFSGIRVRPSVF